MRLRIQKNREIALSRHREAALTKSRAQTVAVIPKTSLESVHNNVTKTSHYESHSHFKDDGSSKNRTEYNKLKNMIHKIHHPKDYEKLKDK